MGREQTKSVLLVQFSLVLTSSKTNGRHRGPLAGVLLALILLPDVHSGGSPDTVDVLYISRWLLQPWARARLLAADPSITVLGVPMPGHSTIVSYGMDVNVMNRMMRMYMPRSYTQLVKERDVIVLHEAPCGSTRFPKVYFDPVWMSWFLRAVKESGMGLTMWGGDASWGGTSAGGRGAYKSWGETILDEILPFNSLGDFAETFAMPHRREFADPESPFARLPWKQAPPIQVLNKVTLKEAAIPIAYAVAGTKKDPWMAWWTAGKGRVLGETQVTGSLGAGHDILNWAWYQDFVVYLVFFVAGKRIPEDIYRVHEARWKISQFLTRMSLFTSVLDFVESFGADTTSVYNQLRELAEREREAEGLYRKEQYDEALRVLRELGQSWTELDQRAVSLKEKALAWVYLIEWLVVTGVMLVSGVAIWVLMVRRTVYREVHTTTTR